MTETIGNVTLDLSKYPGEDFYSEGAGEDLLLQLVKDNPPEQYNRVIAENPGWSVLYHLSELRGNIVDFLPITKNDKVLEVGAGCGAITGTLSEKAGSVTCIELSKKRSLINAYRNKDKENINIRVGNFEDIESDLPNDFDYIMLIGVFEYAASYIHADKPYDTFLKILTGHLKNGGRLVIAIENKYGLKYWAGCREDHLGTFYSGISGYAADSPVKTFSRKRLLKFAKKSGCSVMEYYPYPDYKLPTTIYSEDHLPKSGELYGNVPNFDNTRIVAFDEAKVFNELIEEEEFQNYSNSYLLMLEKPGRVESFAVRTPVYSKHSNERSELYAIRTDIERDGNNHHFAVKYPLKKEAYAHVAQMPKSYEKLKEQYVVSVFDPVECVLRADGACEFEYTVGDTLSEILIELLKNGKKEEALGFIDRYADELRALPETDYVNLDLIFSNIIPQKDKWAVLDYEWIGESGEKADFVLFRALYYFISEAKGAGVEVDELNLYDRYEISLKDFIDKENELQQQIAGERLSLNGLYSLFGLDAVPIEKLMERGMLIPRPDRVKVFYDMGNGYNEKDSYFVTAAVNKGDRISVDIPIWKGAKSIRLDPTEEPCMISMKEMPVEEISITGRVIGSGKAFFGEPDPQMFFETLPESEVMHLEYVLSSMSPEFFATISEVIENKCELERKRVQELFKRKEQYEKLRLS